MRIALVTLDSRGGVQPYLALGAGLHRAGHDVVVLAPRDYADLVAGAGLAHAPLSVDLEAEARRVGAKAHGNALGSMRMAAREMEARVGQLALEALDALAGCDLVLGRIGEMATAMPAAEKLGIPFLEAHLQPLGAPTTRYPGPLFGSTPRILGPVGRLASHHVTAMAVTLPFRGAAARVRRDVLGLSGRPASPLPDVLYGFSRHVVPMPLDGPRPRHVTGYWFLPAPAGWSMPADLEAFLAAPGPVVSVGFGSMAGEDPAGMARLVAGAARDAGVRVVLLTGWGALRADGTTELDADGVHVARSVPHDLLFPRVTGAVHHGGAGTTAAAIRAGVPSLVVPFGVDQPFWGSRVAALGVGPTPIPRARLTRAGLAGALRRLAGDEAMRSRAAALGGLVRAEDGVAEAVRVIGALDLRA